MLSVPRDLLVDIPGYGPNKINAAYSYGGARLSLEVVKHLLGVPINDFIDVNFEGFVGVVDKLGGSYLMIDHRYYNNTAVTDYASIDIEPGYQLLNGHQTLDFVRFRHDQDGDFTRIVRQQMFLREMKRQLAASATITSFPRLFSVATIMSHYVVSDIASLSRIYGLVTLALRLNTQPASTRRTSTARHRPSTGSTTSSPPRNRSARPCSSSCTPPGLRCRRSPSRASRSCLAARCVS